MCIIIIEKYSLLQHYSFNFQYPYSNATRRGRVVRIWNKSRKQKKNAQYKQIQLDFRKLLKNIIKPNLLKLSIDMLISFSIHALTCIF